MPTSSTLALFAVAALGFLAVPGPAVLYIVTRSVHQGRVAVGSLVHTAAAALGVSAVLMTSATAFTTVKLAGAAYLVWVGLQRLLVRREIPLGSVGAAVSKRRAFAQGVVVNVLNPKTALFFFAFLPQFADPARGPVAPQMAMLGILLATLGVLSDSTYAWVSGSASGWLRRNPRFVRASDRAAGGVYVALGVAAAVARRPAAS